MASACRGCRDSARCTPLRTGLGRTHRLRCLTLRRVAAAGRRCKSGAVASLCAAAWPASSGWCSDPLCGRKHAARETLTTSQTVRCDLRLCRETWWCCGLAGDLCTTFARVMRKGEALACAARCTTTLISAAYVSHYVCVQNCIACAPCRVTRVRALLQSTAVPASNAVPRANALALRGTCLQPCVTQRRRFAMRATRRRPRAHRARTQSQHAVPLQRHTRLLPTKSDQTHSSLDQRCRATERSGRARRRSSTTKWATGPPQWASPGRARPQSASPSAHRPRRARTAGSASTRAQARCAGPPYTLPDPAALHPCGPRAGQC